MSRVLGTLIILLTAAPVPSNAQTPEPEITVGTSVAIPDSTVAGIVFDARNGNPLPGASVTAVGTGLGNVTDSMGRFSFSIAGVTGPKARIKIAALGFVVAEILAPIERHGGIGVSVGLQPGLVLICAQGDGIVPGRDTIIEARDILTGEKLSSPISVVVADSVNSERVTQQGQTTFRRILHAGQRLGNGPLKVTVIADGYAEWVRGGIQRDVCGSPIGARPLHVWLLPIRKN